MSFHKVDILKSDTNSKVVINQCAPNSFNKTDFSDIFL